VKSRPLIIVAAVVVIALIAVAWPLLSPANKPVTPTGQPLLPPEPVDVTGPVAPTAPGEAAKPPVAVNSAKTREAAAPPLVPGSPLNDDRFADISARIVIASVGLKKQANWDFLVLEYMNKTLGQEKVSPEQYKEYAEALYRNPDRGRAVGENIMRRVEKKLGTRVDMKALPFFKFDQKDVKALERKLKQ
jgi:hypothetical protein